MPLKNLRIKIDYMKLLEDYKSNLKLIEVEELFDLVFYRPLAFLFVKTILKTNITPNQITIGSVLFGVMGSIVIGLNFSEFFWVAGILVMTYNVLDCSDGQLARIKKNGTELGRIIDGLGDYVVSVAAYLAIGFGFASNSNNPAFFWLLTIAAGISNAFQSSLVDYYRNRFLDYAFDRESLLEDSLKTAKENYAKLKKEKNHSFDKFVYWVYIGYSEVQLKFSSAKENVTEKKYDKADYYNKNKVMIHLWTYLGPTTQWTLFITACFLNRFDLYLYTIAGILNILAVLFIVSQKIINRNTKKVHV